MNKTSIEWTNYSWNPVTGCTKNCWYCYVQRLEKRFGYDRTPAFHKDRLNQPPGVEKGSKIFVCSTGDLFGEGILSEWIDEVLAVVKKCPHVTFQFLTKNPARYDWYDFPGNCWLGTTITGKEQDQPRLYAHLGAKNKNIRFISFEPLLDNPQPMVKGWQDWVIIGAMTGQDRALYQPKVDWIKNIIIQADKLRIPVFMKNNMRGTWSGKIRQEFPV